eukprot:CAMPEP_0172906590 /NCGR_PEP_ID=MMETSP1075-20121228/177175_1 /TAXON_ID=2916 /ORGANISM="Ceratium fusus, Strain PA161109" /LENGTH=47 /DNA_ID= /DNA_START= /DNA_END= /DNA_ORIENTATION=
MPTKKPEMPTVGPATPVVISSKCKKPAKNISHILQDMKSTTGTRIHL